MAVSLFFIPHQDDEALTFGAGIRKHLDMGEECHVILYTDGIASGFRMLLNGEMKCSLHNIVHNPRLEGYSYLEEVDFSNCRDHEFNRSCLALGVPATNIHISRHSMRDGNTTIAGCEAVISEFVKKFPGARIKTFTDLGANHRDHANMGKAGRNLLKSGHITDFRMYVEPYNLKNAKKEDRSQIFLTERSVINVHKVVNAINEYKR